MAGTDRFGFYLWNAIQLYEEMKSANIELISDYHEEISNIKALINILNLKSKFLLDSSLIDEPMFY